MDKVSRLIAGVLFHLLLIRSAWTLKAGYEELHIYDYKADISVGVDQPANYISKYSLHGLINVQRDVDQVAVSRYKYLISLTDVKHESYYGEDVIRVSKYEPIDEKILGNAFTAFYKPSGQLESTVFEKNEVQWSKQIKNSIAKLLQFDWSVVQKDMNTEGQVHVVPTEENTIHGKCFVNYNATLIKKVSRTEKKMNLIKTYYPTKCNNFVHTFDGYFQSDEASLHTIKKRLDHEKTKVQSIYELDIIGKQAMVKKVFNSESYRYDFDFKEFKFSRNPLFVKVRQTLFLKKTQSGYDFLHKSDNFIVNNPNIINQKQTIGKMKELLLEVNEYMKENHLVEIKPGAEHSQLFNRIHRYFKDLTTDNYEDLLNDIDNMKMREKEALRRIFIQIIPYVGRKSSTLFIKNMIMTKKVSDSEAISLISQPTYIHNANKILPELEIFLIKKNGLSPKVQQSTVLSFSYLLGKVCKNNYKFDKELLEKYIQSIDALMKGALTIDDKLTYLTALGNTQCHSAIKYVKSVLLRHKNDSKGANRLRMLAIFILPRLIDEDDSEVLEELSKILHDRSETKEMRVEAYRVLIQRSELETEDLIEIGRLMSTDDHLRNYHLTTMRILNKIGILTDSDLSKIDPKKEKLSPLILGNEVMELDDSLFMLAELGIPILKILDLDVVKQFLTHGSSKRTFLRAACMRNYDLSLSLASVPFLFELEFFYVDDGKIIVHRAIYLHNNLASYDGSNEDEGAFNDLVYVNDGHFTTYSLDVSKLFIESIQDADQSLKFILNLLEKSLEKSWFQYSNLETYFLPTGFGIDAVYQYKRPSLSRLKITFDWTLKEDYVEAQIKPSFNEWTHGYCEVFVDNPLSQRKHSARKTHIQDTAISTTVVVKYYFPHVLELTIPLISEDLQSKMMLGKSDYISSSVMITDRNGDIDCPSCGYKYTTKPDFVKPTRRYDNTTENVIGISYNTITYNCDLPEGLDSFVLSKLESVHPYVIANTCGHLQLLEPDGSKSQIEFMMAYDNRKTPITSLPWYYLPRLEMNIESSLGARRTHGGDISTLAKFSIIGSNSQGHFLNEGRARFVIRWNEHENFNMCIDGKAHCSNLADTQVPSSLTNLKSVMNIRLAFGQSKDESCEKLERSIDVTFSGEIPPEHVEKLKKYSRNSKCAKQMRNSTFTYPPGSYLMTKPCIYELISNTTFRRIRTDIKSDKTASFSVMMVHHLVEELKKKTKEFLLKRENLDVEIKLLSKLYEIRSNNTVSLQIDASIPGINKVLPSVYFSAEFVKKFIHGVMMVINVYPKLVLFNNSEKKQLAASLKDWTLITSNDNEPPYNIYVTLLEDDKLRVKLVHGDQQLMLEPLEKGGNSGKNFVPRVFYNGLVEDFAERAFLKSSEVILFSLLKVDGYLVVRPTEIPMTIYYSINSVTILK